MDKIFSLSWGEFSSNISETFKDIRKSEELTDVTLACEDGELSAHKLILYGGSDFFRSVLIKVKHKHPLIYIKGVKLKYLEAIVDFMYHGEVSVPQDDLNTLLEAAKDLKVRGLSENKQKRKSEESDDSSQNNLKTKLSEDKTDLDEEYFDNGDDYQDIDNYIEPELLKNIEVNNTKHNEGKTNSIKSEADPLPGNEDVEGKVSEFMERLREQDGLSKWMCKICKKSHGDKSKIRKHVKSHLTSQLKEPRVNPDSPYYSVRFSDGVKTCSTNEELQTKVLSLMEKEEGLDHKVTWSCKECKRSASDKSRIRKHVESHIEGLTFNCLLCEVKRSGSIYMNVHISKNHSNPL